MKDSINQYTGRNSTGFRFCFHVRAIAHRPLFLPLDMKDLPHIKSLLDGDSPLDVFDCSSIQGARQAFCELRKRFDFAYWAATEYLVRDIQDADRIVPLLMNSYQHYLIDIMEKRYFNRLPSRYVVTKSFRSCGVTTVVQAYILWRQTYQCQNNAYTCSSSDISLHPLRSDICRHLHRDIVPSEKWIYLPKVDRRTFHNTFRNPDFIRGINLGYVHFADMSRWKDPDGSLSSRAFNAAVSAVLNEYFTLVVFEGNIPKKVSFRIDSYLDFRIPFRERMVRLRPLTNNPFFLDYVALTHLPDCPSYLVHIDLDDTFHPTRSIHIAQNPPTA